MWGEKKHCKKDWLQNNSDEKEEEKVNKIKIDEKREIMRKMSPFIVCSIYVIYVLVNCEFVLLYFVTNLCHAEKPLKYISHINKWSIKL